MSHLIGSVEVGKLADLVLWKPQFFGTKPELVIKGGVIAWSQMGDPNASIPTPQPVFMRPMFGGFHRASSPISIAFTSKASVEADAMSGYDLKKRIAPVENCRGVRKSDMKLNNALPALTVDPETYEVTADGARLACDPAEKLPLAQRYYLF